MDASDRTCAVPIIEAARLLGKTPDAVHGLIRRGTLSSIRGNDGHHRVLLPDDLATVATDRARDGRDQAPPGRAAVATGRGDQLMQLLAELRDVLVRTRAERDRALADADRARELEQEVGRLRIEVAKAGAEQEAIKAVALADVAAAQDMAAAELATVRAELALRVEMLEREQARAAELAAELRELRRPWWRRLLG